MKKILLLLSFVLTFGFMQAQTPIQITQPYNFLKYIKVHDSIRASIYLQNPKDTLATKNDVRNNVPNLSEYVAKNDTTTYLATKKQLSDALAAIQNTVNRKIVFNDIAVNVSEDYYEKKTRISSFVMRGIVLTEYSYDNFTFLTAIAPMTINANTDIYWRVSFSGGSGSGLLIINGLLIP